MALGVEGAAMKITIQITVESNDGQLNVAQEEDQEKTGAIPTSHRMSPASLVAEATASRAIPRSKHGLDLA